MSQDALPEFVQATATRFGIPGVAAGVRADGFFTRDDIMTRRFSVGHNRGEDGTLLSRGCGGVGAVKTPAGPRVLGGRPAALGPVPFRRWPRGQRCPCPARRDAAGDEGANGRVAGQQPRRRDWHRLVPARHRRGPHRRARRSANGQFAELLTVPERSFAVVSMSNAGPDGVPFNQAVVRWALQTYLGVTDRDPAVRSRTCATSASMAPACR